MERIITTGNVECQAFEEAMAIYEASFPSEERHSLAKIMERISAGRERLYCRSKGGVTIGIALVWDLHLKNFLVLDYFAIKENYRCNGHGRAFLTALLKIFENEGRALIIEVEEYRNANTPERRARAKFYRSLGFREILDFEYVMPPIDGQSPVDMALMLSPNFHRDRISRESLLSIVKHLYEQMYYLPSTSEFAAEQFSKINKPFYFIG